MSLQSKSTIRFRSDIASAWATSTRNFLENELLLVRNADGTISPSVRVGSGTYANSIAIGQVIDRSASAINATATITAAELRKGLITSTSAAGVTATLPTATLLAAALGAQRGTSMEFIVDNSVGASTVTVAVGSGITVATAVVTGADTLTVAATKVGIFKIVFISATAALLYRQG